MGLAFLLVMVRVLTQGVNLGCWVGGYDSYSKGRCGMESGARVAYFRLGETRSWNMELLNQVFTRYSVEAIVDIIRPRERCEDWLS